MSKRGKFIQKNSEKLNDESTQKEYLNAEKMLIKKLKERKKAFSEFLSQIEHFIAYGMEQAKIVILQIKT